MTEQNSAEDIRAQAKAAMLDRVKSGTWLDQQTFDPVQWFVEGILPEGYGLLTGPPKIGKSWLVLDFALAISRGSKALGSIDCKDRPVFYMALEDSDRRMKDRCDKLSWEDDTFHSGSLPENFDFYTDPDPAAIFYMIEFWLEEHPDGAIFLDTLGKVMPPQEYGESQYQRDYRIGSKLKALAGKFPGSAIVVVHHTKKGAEDDWMNSTSGTNGLNGAADYTINLARNRGSDEGVLRGTGRDTEEFEFAVTFDAGRWSLYGGDESTAKAHAAEAAAEIGVGDKSVQILRIVNEHPEGISPSDVAATLADGTRSNAVGTYLRRLAETGRVRKEGRGKYVPINRLDEAEVLA